MSTGRTRSSTDPLSKTVSRALEEAGIKESLRARRVGLYELKELIDEADHFQDWLATHSETGIHRRIRIYLTYGKSPNKPKPCREPPSWNFVYWKGSSIPAYYGHASTNSMTRARRWYLSMIQMRSGWTISCHSDSVPISV